MKMIKIRFGFKKVFNLWDGLFIAIVAMFIAWLLVWINIIEFV